MRFPKAPLRKSLAVFVSFALLPWQEPLAALAQTTPVVGPSPVVFTDADKRAADAKGLKLDKPREAVAPLEAALAARLADLRRDDLPGKDADALPAAFLDLRGKHEALQSASRELAPLLTPPAKAVVDATLATQATHYALIKAVVEHDLAGLRRDLVAARAEIAVFSRPPPVLSEAEWEQAAKVGPGLPSEIRKLKERVRKASDAVVEVPVAGEFRVLVESLRAAFESYSTAAGKIDVAAFLAARTTTASGDAAVGLMSEVTRHLPKDSIPEGALRVLNVKMAGYLRSGDPAQLATVMAEIDALYDAAKVDKRARAEVFDRLSQVAEQKAQALTAATTVTGADANGLVNAQSRRLTDTQSLRRMDAAPLELGATDERPRETPPSREGWTAFQRAGWAIHELAPDGTGIAAALADWTIPAAVRDNAQSLARSLLGQASALRFEDSLDQAEARVAELETGADAATRAGVPSAEMFSGASLTLDGLAADPKAKLSPARERFAALRARIKAASEKAAGRIAASEKAAAALAQSYEKIQKAVTDLVLLAPDRSADPRPETPNAAARYDAKWKKPLDDHKKQWAAAVAFVTRAEADLRAVQPFAEDLAPLEAARTRAETLAKLLRALTDQRDAGAIDITTWSAEHRRRILSGEAGGPELGEFGRAIVWKSETEAVRRENGRKVMAAFNGLSLTGDPVADAAALDAFFDSPANKTLLAGADLPPAFGDWVAARAFQKQNEARVAAGQAALPPPPELPTAADAYGRMALAARWDRARALGDGVARGANERFVAQYELNRTAYLALGCDPAKLVAAEKVKPNITRSFTDGLRSTYEGITARVGVGATSGLEEGGAHAGHDGDQPVVTAADDDESPVVTPAPATAGMTSEQVASFCARFLARVELPGNANDRHYQSQREITDEIRGFLESQELTAVSQRADAAQARMITALRRLTPEERAEIVRNGGDVDGILRQREQSEVLRWAATVYEMDGQNDPKRWRSFRDQVADVYFGDHLKATRAQAQSLREAAGSGDPATIASAFAGIESPEILTSGFLAAIPRKLASDRARSSSRDRALLRAWNGAVEGDAAPAEQSLAGAMLKAAGQLDAEAAGQSGADAAESRRLAGVLRGAATDPSDPERTAEALRAVGAFVYDARATRVAFDATKVSFSPTDDEGRRDLTTFLSLLREFKMEAAEAVTPAGAAKLKAAFLERLRGPMAEQLEQSRADQLILSAQDEYMDRVGLTAKAALTVMGGRLGLATPPAGREPADRQWALNMLAATEGNAALKQLRAFAANGLAFQDETFALARLSAELGRSGAGRAQLGLPGAFATAKAQALTGLYGEHTPHGFTVSGWMVGLPDAKEVTRDRYHRAAGVPAGVKPPADPNGVVAGVSGVSGIPLDAPRARVLDGVTFTQSDGARVFRSLKGDYTETARARAGGFSYTDAEGRAHRFNGAIVSATGSDGKPLEAFRSDGKLFVSKREVVTDPGGRQRTVTRLVEVPAGAASGAVAVENVRVTRARGGRTLVTDLDRTSDGRVLRYTNSWQGSSQSVTLDLEARTQSVDAGGKRFVFDLDASNGALAEDRRHQVWTSAPGTTPQLLSTTYFDLKEKRIVRETPEDGMAGVTRIQDLVPSDGRAFASLSVAERDALLVTGALRADQSRDEQDKPKVDFRVQIDREGLTARQISDRYRELASALASRMSMTEAGFTQRFADLANLYDGQAVGKEGASAVSFELGRGGSLLISGQKFNETTYRTEGWVPEKMPRALKFEQFPKDAPHDMRGAGNMDQSQKDHNKRQQDLAALRLVTGYEGGFVFFDGGRVRGFVGSYVRETPAGESATRADGRVLYHTFELSEKTAERDDGSWNGSDHLVRTIKVDGKLDARSIVVGNTTGPLNFHEHAGEWVNNRIRYSDFGKANPMWGAVLGAVAGGFTVALLDPGNLLWGGGLALVNVVGRTLVKATSIVIRTVGTLANYTGKAIDVYFKVKMAEGMIVSGGTLAEGISKGNADLVNSGLMGMTTALAGLAVGRVMDKGTQWLGNKVGGKIETGLINRGLMNKGDGAGAGAGGKAPRDEGAGRGDENAGRGRRDTDQGGRQNQGGRGDGSTTTGSNGGRSRGDRGGRGSTENSGGRGDAPTTPRGGGGGTPPSRWSPRQWGASIMSKMGFGERGSTLDAASSQSSMAGAGGRGGGEAIGTRVTANNAGAASGAAGGKSIATSADPVAAGKPAPGKGDAPTEAAPASPDAAKTTAAADPTPAAKDAAPAKTPDAIKPAEVAAAPGKTAPLVADPVAAARVPQTPNQGQTSLAMPGGLKAPGTASAALRLGVKPDAAGPLTPAANGGVRGPPKDGVTTDPVATGKKSGTPEPVAKNGEPTTPELVAKRGEADGPQATPEDAGFIPESPATAGTPKSGADAAPSPAPKKHWLLRAEETVNGSRAGKAFEAATAKFQTVVARVGAVKILDGTLGDAVKVPWRMVQTSGWALERVAGGMDAIVPGVKTALGRVGLFLGFKGAPDYFATPRDPVTGVRLVEATVVEQGPDGAPVTVRRMVPAQSGFLVGMVRDFGNVLQGKPFATPGERTRLEEIWRPDLTTRRSFRDAITPELAAKGGELVGRYDPKSGRTVWGEKAANAEGVEVVVRLRPGERGPEIEAYEARGGDPRARALAEYELGRAQEAQFGAKSGQASLADVFASREAANRLAERLDKAGERETFLDLRYDPASKTFRLAETGDAGATRVRLKANESGALELVEAFSLAPGGRLPAAAEHNLRMFAARGGVSLRPGALAKTVTDPVEIGRRAAEFRKRSAERVEAENLVREELALEAEGVARGKLAKAGSEPLAFGESAAGLRDRVADAARRTADAKRRTEIAAEEAAAADRALAELGGGRATRVELARAESALLRREALAREAAKVRDEAAALEASLGALPEGAPREAPLAALQAARLKFAELARQAKIAEENLAASGARLSEGGVDALVRRVNAEKRLEAARLEGREALADYKTALRDARAGGVATRGATAEGRLQGALEANALEYTVLAYRRDGLHRSVGADGRALYRAREGALAGALQGKAGRAIVGQEAGRSVCVLASFADAAALRLGRPVEGALGRVEASILEIHRADAVKQGRSRAEGEAEGREFLARVSEKGLSPLEMDLWFKRLAEADGLSVESVKAGEVKARLEAGETISMTLTTEADAGFGYRGGPHMVNITGLKTIVDPVTGRSEAWVQLADPNARVLTGYSDGAPVYEARAIPMRLADVLAMSAGRLGGSAETLGYSLASGRGDAGPRGPPESFTPVEGVGSARRLQPFDLMETALPGPRQPSVKPVAYLPSEIYTPELMALARARGDVFEVGRTGHEKLSDPDPSVRFTYVIIREPGGRLSMTVGRVEASNAREVAVKHAALAEGRPTLFAGELVRDPSSGRLRLDLQSGTYSHIGFNPDYVPNAKNAAALAKAAAEVLGVEIVAYDHINGRAIELTAADRSAALDASRSVVEGVGAGDRIYKPSIMDRLSLSKAQVSKAQEILDAANTVADMFEASGAPRPKIADTTSHLTNAPGVLSLWWQAVRHGDARMRATAFHPAQLFAMVMGVIGNTPIEGVRFREGKVSQVGYSGHGAGLLSGGLVSILSWGAGRFAERGANKPAHEISHAVQHLVLGLAVEKGALGGPSDVLGIQNTRGAYLWGGRSEKAAQIAEKTGKLDALFDAMRGNAAEHFARKHSADPETARAKNLEFSRFLEATKAEMAAKHPELFDAPPALTTGPEVVAAPKVAAPEGVGAAETGNLALLMRAQQSHQRPSLTKAPAEWLDGSATRPRVELTRELSAEGSSGIVFEGRLNGEPVAVKAFSAPFNLAMQSWADRIGYMQKEVGLHRDMVSALPKGWAARMHGEVETGGSPAIAMELARGLDPNQLTLRQALQLTERSAVQAAEAIQRLADRGLGGGDSPQIMILTEPQVINGVARKAGDILMMDAGGLQRGGNRSSWKTPEREASYLLLLREIARRAKPEELDIIADDIHGKMDRARLDEAQRAADALLPGVLQRASVSAKSGATPEGVGSGEKPASPRLIERAGNSRGEGWTVDGKPVNRVGGGGFKEVLDHPTRPDLVLKLFTEVGSRDLSASLSERRNESRRLAPLQAIGRAPRTVEEGAVEVGTRNGKRGAGYMVQERVSGRELGEVLADKDASTRAAGLREARALFDDLVKARIRLDDTRKMAENIVIGKSGASKVERALVIDAGEAEVVPAQGFLDRVLSRPDPLRAFYDKILRDFEYRARTGRTPEGVGASDAGGGFFGRLFGGAKTPAAIETASFKLPPPVAPSALGLKTIEMKATTAQSERRSQVQYLDRAQRARYEARVAGGRLIDAKGQAIDTGDATTGFATGIKTRDKATKAAIFALDANGTLYLHKYPYIGQFHHSSFLAGGPVAGAGEIVVRDGFVIRVNNGSGHYKPDAAMARQVLARLREMGLDLSRFEGVWDVAAGARLDGTEAPTRRAPVVNVEGVGAGDGKLPEVKGPLGPKLLAAGHYFERWDADSPQAERAKGVKAAHELSLFLESLTGQGEIVDSAPVPGYPGMEVVRYKLYKKDAQGRVTTELQAKERIKTVVDGKDWGVERLGDLSNVLFGSVLGDGHALRTLNGVTFVGIIRSGELRTFGAENWPGKADADPMAAPENTLADLARASAFASRHSEAMSRDGAAFKNLVVESLNGFKTAKTASTPEQRQATLIAAAEYAAKGQGIDPNALLARPGDARGLLAHLLAADAPLARPLPLAQGAAAAALATKPGVPDALILTRGDDVVGAVVTDGQNTVTLDAGQMKTLASAAKSWRAAAEEDGRSGTKGGKEFSAFLSLMRMLQPKAAPGSR